MLEETGTKQSGSSRPYEEWVRSIKNRDSDSWEILVRFFGDDLRSAIEISLQKRKLPLTLVDDIEQETWLTALRKIEELIWEDDEKFFHWLRAVALNHIRNTDRLRSREETLDDVEEGDAERDNFYQAYTLRAHEHEVEDVLIAQEQMQALVAAMRVLKPVEREILVRWLMGETPRKLALEYGRNARSVSTLVLRAKHKVEANLSQLQEKKRRDKRE